MLNLECSVTINGSSYTSYVVSIERTHSICEGMATGNIELSFGASLPDTYDPVVIEELGTKVFTGYVVNVTKGRMPIEYIVEIADPVIRLADYWTETLYESTGETAEYWIGFFCDLAGVSYQFDVSYNRIVPDNTDGSGIEWQYSSALTIIRELLVIGGFYMWSDADGVIHFSDINTGRNSNDPDILSINRVRSITPSRNKAIVFGKRPISASAQQAVEGLDWEKTAVVASPYVETTAYAQDLASKMMTHFARQSDVIQMQIIGIPSLRVGQELHYFDSWLGLDDYGIVVKLSSRMENNGYTMVVTINELCPFIWGYMQVVVVTVTLYAGTAGQGVWRTQNLGVSWEDITSDIPSNSHYINGISASGAVVWAATEGGVYYTSNGAATPSGVTWTSKTPSPLPSGVTATNWTDVEIDPNDSQTVYVLMDDETNYRVYMHKTDDNGSTWSYTQVT